jgi:hypothetical protein
MFPTFELCRPGYETETNQKLFIIHLGALQKQFPLCQETLMFQNLNGLEPICR